MSKKIPGFFVDETSQVPLTDLGLFLMALSGTKISRGMGDFLIHRHRLKANSCEMRSLKGFGKSIYLNNDLFPMPIFQ